jgi:enoyl-CoA hydratase/carnithine racemase
MRRQPIRLTTVSDLVITEDREAVRHVILNRPEKRNAFNEELVLATGAALRAAADDPSVRCVVLRGNGPVFSAGMDVAALANVGTQPERLRTFRRACLQAWNLCEEMTKPVVAQIHGVCLGGALELALACDMRVLSDDAFVGLPETRLGLVPDVGGSSRLPQVVGLGRAKELIMTGRVIGAQDAERIGLAKRLIDASARPALSTTLELEVAAQELCARSQDIREGVQAAAERRAPVFKGA